MVIDKISEKNNIFVIIAHPWLTRQHSRWQYCSLAHVVTSYKTEKKTMKQHVATSVTQNHRQ